jgi:hypothetical protein
VENAGSLVSYESRYNYSNVAVGGDKRSTALGAAANSTYTDEFGNNSGSISLSGNAEGSVISNGISNSVSAAITTTDYNGSQYIQGVSQAISSSLTRSFSVEANAEVTINASIEGITEDFINWAIYNYDWDADPSTPNNPYSSWSDYRITASVTVIPGVVVNAGTVDIPAPLNLNEDTTSGTLSFIAADDPDNPDLYYKLITSLTIETRVSNFDNQYPGGSLGELPDVGTIGPLIMETTASATSAPVPGSMILLFSGFAGLTAVLRRRKN